MTGFIDCEVSAEEVEVAKRLNAFVRWRHCITAMLLRLPHLLSAPAAQPSRPATRVSVRTLTGSVGRDEAPAMWCTLVT